MMISRTSSNSLIAQLVERRTVNPQVPGSSPGRGARIQKGRVNLLGPFQFTVLRHCVFKRRLIIQKSANTSYLFTALVAHDHDFMQRFQRQSPEIPVVTGATLYKAKPGMGSVPIHMSSQTAFTVYFPRMFSLLIALPGKICQGTQRVFVIFRSDGCSSGLMP